MLIGAVDIGGTKTMLGILSGDGKILKKINFKTDNNNCYAHVTYCCNELRKLVESLDICLADLTGIGVSLPGMVDKSQGVLIRAPFADWNNIQVVSAFTQETCVQKVYIENDVNACAIGELLYGSQYEYSDFLWMTVSTGVGGAVIVRNKLIEGAVGCAGEIGHVKVEYEKPYLCPCGQLGCLEAHASGTAITRYTVEAAKQDKTFSESLNKENLSYDAAGCARLAESGNKTAEEIYHRAGVYLGRGISYYINLLNPQAVIIGGGVAGSFHLLHAPIQKTIAESVISTIANVDVVRTELKYEAALIGAAALVKYYEK